MKLMYLKIDTPLASQLGYPLFRMLDLMHRGFRSNLLKFWLWY